MTPPAALTLTLPLHGQVLMDVAHLDNYRETDQHRHVVDSVDDARVITSLCAGQPDDGPRMHRPVLDVDMPVTAEQVAGGRTRVRIAVPVEVPGHVRERVDEVLAACGIVHHADPLWPGPGLTFESLRPVVVVPSSTPGHHHLYIDRRLTWRRYRGLLETLEAAEVLEPGYVHASVTRRHTTVRLPWVRKQQPSSAPDNPSFDCEPVF